MTTNGQNCQKWISTIPREGKTALCIYELNEVPPRLLEYYTRVKPHSNLARLASDSIYRTTITRDEGELHPWSTWPTLHRGVPNNVHNIRYINQDVRLANSLWPPIWSRLADQGIDVGIFGSLQSYPPLKGENILFYVPDTFSPDCDCFPEALQCFQRFNLSLAGKNKAIQRSFDLNDIIQFTHLCLRGQASPRFVLASIKQIAREVFDQRWKSRRSLIQPVAGFDVFLSSLKRYRPRFSTFFTNHTAGMMHRYWKHLFPQDFTDSTSSLRHPSHTFHSTSIIRAMDIADRQIGRLLSLPAYYKQELWILSSMGQAAIDRGSDSSEIFLDDWKLLLRHLGLNVSRYRIAPAMQPDVCFHCDDAGDLNMLRKALARVSDVNGEQIFRDVYPPVGNTINFSLNSAGFTSDERSIKIDNHLCPLADLGFSLIFRDIGTAYHVPEGIFLAHGARSRELLSHLSNDPVDTSEISNLIESFFGLR